MKKFNKLVPFRSKSEKLIKFNNEQNYWFNKIWNIHDIKWSNLKSNYSNNKSWSDKLVSFKW